MEPTRRVWVVVAVGGAGAVLAIAFSNPLLLGVPVGVGMWAVAHQLSFARSLGRIRRADPPLIRQSLVDESVYAGDSTDLRVAFGRSEAMSGLDADLTVTLPPALTDDTMRPERRSDGDGTERPDGDGTEIVVPVRTRVAGAFEIRPQTLHVTSGHGLFTETIRVGNGCTLTVEPAVPTESRHGPDAAELGGLPGEHDAAAGVSGYEHGNARPYTPSDPMNRIDWNVTARVGTPHVRDPDPQTVRETRVYVDRRNSMREGPPGETKLDRARDIGLLLTAQAADGDDPLAVSFVDREGVTEPSRTASGADHYRRVRRRLHTLTAGSDETEDVLTDGTTGGESLALGPTARSDPLSVRRDAVRRARSLGHADTFARTLAPYFEAVTPETDGVTDDGLFDSVAGSIREHGTDPWIAVVTDASNYRELRSVAALAESHGVDLSVFLLSSADAGDDATAASTANRSRAFGWLVRELRGHEGVRVSEVDPRERAPGDDARPTRGRP